MDRYEYKVVPAPRRGAKAKGLKSSEARFAHALSVMINDAATDGWAYLRAESLPSEERSGLGRKTTTSRSVLVFRRHVVAEEAPLAGTPVDVPMRSEPTLTASRDDTPEAPEGSKLAAE